MRDSWVRTALARLLGRRPRGERLPLEERLTLRQLRRVCEETLILGAATTPERAYPQAAVFLPHLDAKQRAGLLPAPTPHALKRGLDTAYEPERGYGNWFWLPTPTCVRAMLRVAGFEVVEAYDYPRAICIVARAGEAALQPRRASPGL
jgi:hypothetical protein